MRAPKPIKGTGHLLKALRTVIRTGRTTEPVCGTVVWCVYQEPFTFTCWLKLRTMTEVFIEYQNKSDVPAGLAV